MISKQKTYICIKNVTIEMSDPTKKEQIDLTAKTLFWKHGFRRVSVAEICEKADVSRKTYYTYYENKNKLVLSLLETLFSGARNDVKTIFESEAPFSDKIKQIMDFKFKMSETWSKEFLADILQNPEIHDYYLEWAKASMNMTRDFFMESQKKGEVNPDLNIDYVMLMLQKYMEWLDDPNFLNFFASVEEITKQMTYLFVFGIMPVEKG